MPDQFPDHAVPVASGLLHSVGVVSNQAQPICKQGRQIFIDSAISVKEILQSKEF